MPRLFLVPKKDAIIPDPATRPSRPLPETGGWVEASPYWTNRLLEGDVTDDTKAQAERDEEAEEKAARDAEAAAKAAEAEAKKAAKAQKTEN